ncbi:MAG: RNA polymerase sigma factor RpoD/SigA [Candidatus Kerfeldbacteria bacterium]|nr:RNA polymerase sigma factor RpoD/SigA [Candidatus Kerfeldbacteria bacterium]
MDDLLREWHHVRGLSLSAIALIWTSVLGNDIALSWLEYLAERYGVAVRAHDNALVETTIAAGAAIASADSAEPFSGIGGGIIAQRIVNLWQYNRSWSRVLSRLFQQDNRVTLSWLQSFVVQHGAAFVNLVKASDLRLLFANDGSVVIEALPQEVSEPAQLAVRQKRKRTTRSSAQLARSSDRPKSDRTPGLRDEDRSLVVYFREVGKTHLIDTAEEVRLAQRIRKGDQCAYEKLVNANLRFVTSVAKQYQNQGVSLGDLINEGNIGLMKAAKRFDETRGFKFISYAVWWIRQAILQALAENSRIVRLPLNRSGKLYKIRKTSDRLTQVLGREPTPDEIAIELALSEDEVDYTMSIADTHLSLDMPLSDELGSDNLIDRIEDTSSVSADHSFMTKSLRAEIEKALDTLTARQADVVTLYFGLNHEHPMTLEEIGAQFSLTRERVRQIKELAIRRLRHASRSRSLRSYLDTFEQGGNH